MEVGLAGRLGAGPSTDVGSGASQMGLTSLADGAATLPAICETAALTARVVPTMTVGTTITRPATRSTASAGARQ